MKSCRLCRREGAKLMLKGERCETSKCAFTKRSYAPGSNSTKRSQKPSEYSIQLREKQKAKAIYGIRENKFKNYYLKSIKSKTATGEKILENLETRLDNVVYRLSLTNSRPQARQLVLHGKILVNNKKINIPSYQVKQNDLITTKIKTSKSKSVSEIPVWLKFDKGNLSGQIIKIPTKSDINSEINDQLIVEYYSR